MQETLPPESYASLLNDLSKSARHIIHDESELIRTELREKISDSQRHIAELSLCFILYAMSGGAFVTFLVIFLARFTFERMDFSALLLGAFFSLTGTLLAWHAMRAIRSDFGFPASRQTLKRLLNVFSHGGQKNL